MQRKFSISCLLTAALWALPAFACPDIDGMLDWNCDGKLEISAFGDSITYGTGDNAGLGYPGRLRKLLPDVRINNFGDPGEKTRNGRTRAPKKFHQRKNADFVIILEGVNDYWDTERSPSRTKDNLLRIVRAAENEGAIAILAKLTSTKRSFQIGWVRSVNAVLGRDKHTRIDFYSLGTKIISGDELHPNGKGYQAMANVAETSLAKATDKLRPRDKDSDGIYDFAEPKFHTNPNKADTDDDGVLDGEEEFTLHTDPVNPDSDGDGIMDGTEVSLHTNPSDARPSAPTLQSLEVTAS